LVKILKNKNKNKNLPVGNDYEFSAYADWQRTPRALSAHHSISGCMQK
jgi:hypothetical protein